MYESPPYYALDVLYDLGSQAAPLLPRLESLESYFRDLPSKSEADRVGEVIRKIRGS